MTSQELDDITEQDRCDGVQQQVVGAVIDHNGRVLLLRRPADDFRGGTWELPSGKVESGEGLQAGLFREVTEETGLVVSGITSYLGAFDYTSGSGRHTRQHTWSVTVEHGDDVRLTEHDAYAWAGSDDDYPVSAEVQALITKHRLSR